MVRRDVIARYGLDPARVVLIYNGVDLERFRPDLKATAGAELRRALGFLPNQLVVLFLGTGYGRKGLAELLDAFPALLSHRADARLIVAGYDSSRAAFEDQARRLHIDEAVRFLGGRSDPEACYAAADLYVLPTLYDPFANSTLEALASGLPVITTTDNGGGEILTSVAGAVLPRERARGENGALASELVAWSDRERLRAAGVAARKLAEAHGQERTVRESTRVLEECAQEKARESARGLPRTAAIP
jgi:UDP-glucose:(heptosyl)LPS alpha-1,3-glucosyltransferase